jgi:hypothetical protein
MKRTKLGVLAAALALAALVSACEAFYWITGAPVDCEVAVDTLWIGPGHPDTATVKPKRCLEARD